MSEERTAGKAPTKTPVYKKWWFWVIIVVVLVCIGAAGASSNKDPKKVGENGESSEQQGEETKEFKVGDVISIDNREMTVEKVQRNWSSEYSKPKDGKEYIMVTVKLENKSDETISYNSGEWKLENGEGAIDTSALVLGNDDAMSYGDLAAGGKKSGTIVYEVPAGDTNLKLHYKPNLFVDREAIVTL